MSSMYHPISTTQSSPSFEDCKKTVQANWEKHKVKILVGTAIIGGGAAILLTGGLAALPEALAAALFFSGTAAVVGGFAYTGYTVFQPTNTDENEKKKPASLSTQTPDPMAEAGKVTVSIQVPNLMEFVELPQVIAQADSKEPTPTITVTIEATPPKEETEETITVTIEEAPEKDAPPSRELKNDDIPEELMFYREEKPEIATPSSINSHIPSSKTTKKLLGYTMVGTAVLATAAYGYQRWYYLPEEEKNAYISQLRQGTEYLSSTVQQGAEYLSSTVQQGLSKMGSSLDIFSQEGDPTGLSFGTDPTNRSLPFPGPLNSCASPANPMRLQFGTDTTTTHFPAPDSTRSYFECYGSRMMNVANDGISSVSSFFASMYNSLPSGESIAEKFSINASSWGDSLEDWTQWASHADPVGEMRNSTMGQNVEKCFSAASEYVTSEGKPGTVQTFSELLESCPYTASAPKLSLEEMGIPFVDLANVKEPLTPTQQGIFQSLQELSTCSPNKELAAEVPSLDFLLSISGK